MRKIRFIWLGGASIVFAMSFVWCSDGSSTDKSAQRRFCEALIKEGLLCKDTHGDIIRFAPPLVIRREDIDWAVPRIEKVLMTL